MNSHLAFPHIALLVVVLCFEIPRSFLYAQLPGWLTIRDADGNKYFVDTAGKIWIDTLPGATVKAVSSDGLPFYLEQGQSLMKNLNKVEGLQMLRSIRLLADYDSSGLARESGKTASLLLNEIRKREGERYSGMILQSPVLLIRVQQTHVLYNEYFGYSIECNGKISLIRQNSVMRYNYIRHGLLAGLREAGSAQTERENYDLLVYVQAEEFHYRLTRPRSYYQMYLQRSVEDFLEKKEISLDETRMIISLESERLRGRRLVCIDGNKGYVVSVIAGKNTFALQEQEIERILDSFPANR